MPPGEVAVGLTLNTHADRLILRVEGNQEVVAEEPESVPFSRKRVRNASNVGYRTGFEPPESSTLLGTGYFALYVIKCDLGEMVR